jgi:hypothetical protein
MLRKKTLMLGKSFTPNHTKLTSSKGAFSSLIWAPALSVPMEGPFLFLPFHPHADAEHARPADELPKKKQRPFPSLTDEAFCHSPALTAWIFSPSGG